MITRYVNIDKDGRIYAMSESRINDDSVEISADDNFCKDEDSPIDDYKVQDDEIVYSPKSKPITAEDRLSAIEDALTELLTQMYI